MDAIVNYLAALPGEMYASIIVMGIITVFAVLAGNAAKKAEPHLQPSTLVWLGEEIVNFVDGYFGKMMGPRFNYVMPYFTTLVMYIPLSFLIGLAGLPAPITYYAVPFSLALVTFVLIHGTAIKYNKWGYFKRFLQPFWPFLPINLFAMYSPLVSMSFRMLGNALSGLVIMSLIYWATGLVSNAILGLFNLSGLNFFGLMIGPFLHFYFDVFSSLIQTLVFLSLSALFIAGEAPSVGNTN